MHSVANQITHHPALLTNVVVNIHYSRVLVSPSYHELSPPPLQKPSVAGGGGGLVCSTDLPQHAAERVLVKWGYGGG